MSYLSSLRNQDPEGFDLWFFACAAIGGALCLGCFWLALT